MAEVVPFPRLGGNGDRHRDLILRAIRECRLVTFRYKSADRTVEPYILGFDRKNVLTLSGVQRAGGSGIGFRTYDVLAMSALALDERAFSGSHPDYNPRDAIFVRVLGRI